MSTITIKDMLRGVTVGNIQTAGNMSVVPLLMPKTYQRQEFTPVSKLTFRSPDFGTMTFANPEDTIGIVPIGYTYIDKNQGQDHALPHTGIVAPKSSTKYNTAACVQSSQSGRLGTREGIDYRMLPYTLRQLALGKRTSTDYNKIWPYIGNLNQAYGVHKSAQHLEYFFDEYDKQLATFVAQFELVPNQVGAIILIGKQVVGVELTPSSEFWENVWEKIIRDVYGSLALLRGKQSMDSFRKPFRTRARTLAGLKRAVKTELQSHKDFVQDIASEFISMNLDTTLEESLVWGAKAYILSTIDNDKLSGQFLCEGSAPVYISVSVLKDLNVGQTARVRREYNSRPAFGF